MTKILHSQLPVKSHATGWRLTGLVYAFATLGVAMVSIIVPMVGRIAHEYNVSTGSIGFSIALFSLPSAIAATLGGGLVDRVGARRSILVSALLMAAGDAIVGLSSSLPLFDLGVATAGFGYTGMAIACPVLLIASTEGSGRVRAMSFWSTNAPTGFSLGLLLAAPFTSEGHWRMGILLHCALMLALVLCVPLLPAVVSATRDAPAERIGARLRSMFSVVCEVPVLRLAIAVALPNAISYGTSLVAPSYLARVHGVSLAASATTVALAKIFAMLVGGVLVGQLLAKNMPPRRLFMMVVLVGVAAQLLIYLPGSSLVLAACALILWIFAFGGAVGAAMTLLPTVARDPRRSGAAAGLVSQFVSVACFLTPNIYFALPGWHAFVLLAAVGMTISLLVLPANDGRRAIAAA